MTREQAALLKKAYDSLRGPKLLAGDELHAFAASRAYYTMFYVAEALLPGEGLSFSKHTAVDSCLWATICAHWRGPSRVSSVLDRWSGYADSRRL
jgi:uncharacterized protein (UPF0332 family)